jgi:hypothetical protein
MLLLHPPSFVLRRIGVCHHPIRIVLVFVIILFPVNIALEVIKQMFEHDESLSQIPDG